MASITEEQIAEMKQFFAATDTNNDGLVTKEELKVVLTKLAIEDAVIDEMMNLIDVNGDGKLELDEFIKLI